MKYPALATISDEANYRPATAYNVRFWVTKLLLTKVEPNGVTHTALPLNYANEAFKSDYLRYYCGLEFNLPHNGWEVQELTEEEAVQALLERP